MARVIFKLSFEEDLKNHTDVPFGRNLTGKTQKDYLPQRLQELIKGKNKVQSKKIIKKYLEDIYRNKRIFLNLAIKQAGQAWRTVEPKFFKRLEKLTKRKICANKFTAYLTLIQSCPYSDKHMTFMFSYLTPTVSIINICAHEILHIQIKNMYRKELSELSKKQRWYLIEALVFLLNEEFSDLLPFKEKSYSAVQKLMEKLTMLWQKNKDFEEFFPKAVEITKRMMK
jgi:hypothetical protein